MHEGQVMAPQNEKTAWPTFDPSKPFTVGTLQVDEYPLSSSKERILPMVVAWGNVKPHTTVSGDDHPFTDDPKIATGVRFGVICAYEGQRAGIGNVVVDSSWHHFFDLNLIGDPLANSPPAQHPEWDKKKGFKATNQGQAVLNDIETYYRNIA